MKVSFITGNKGKLEEFQQILGNDIELEQLDIDLPEIQETDAKAVIEAKLEEAVKHTDNLVIVEDTGLYFNAWNSLPGVLIKWFIKSVGNKGTAKMLDPYEDKSAYAQCTIGFASKGREPVFFEGRINGKIIPPKGEGGFGWDPLFVPDNHTSTFGEMSREEKNRMSMRKIALEKLREYLINQKHLDYKPPL